jgi:sec-independent protein translocase protein TatA
MHTFSFGELALIFGIVVVLFGGSRLASVGKALGEGIANFKKGLHTSTNEEKQLQASSQQSQHSSQPVEGEPRHDSAPKV